MKRVDEKRFEMFSEYALSGVEMFNIRGGDDGGGDGGDDGGIECGGNDCGCGNCGDEPIDPEKPGQVIIP